MRKEILKILVWRVGDILGSAVNYILFKAIIKNKSFDFFSSLVLFGYIWIYLGIFGYIWVYLGYFGYGQAQTVSIYKNGQSRKLHCNGLLPYDIIRETYLVSNLSLGNKE